MRIAFIVDQFPTLSETFILNQITGLIDRGHEVDVYCDRLGNTEQVHPQVEQYHLLTRTYYTSVPNNLLLRAAKAVWLLLLNWFKAPRVLFKACNFLKYNRGRYGDVAGFLKPFYLVIPWLDRPAYDVVLCHYGRNGLKATLFQDLGAIASKIAVVFHGYDLSHYLGIHGADIYKHLFQQADLLLPIGHNWQQKLIALGCSPDKIIVHHMGIDPNQFAYITPQPNKASFRLISIARLVEKKGLKYSIQAIARLVYRLSSLRIPNYWRWNPQSRTTGID